MTPAETQHLFSTAATFFAVLLAIVAVKRFALRRLLDLAKRTDTDWDDALLALLWQIRVWEMAFVAFYLATRGLPLPLSIHKSMRVALVVIVVYRGIRVLQGLVAHFLSRFDMGLGNETVRKAAVRNATYMANVLIWAGGGLFALANLGVNISAMLAGLGIGGVAIALGAQAVFSDLFSAVAIYLDKPFVVGDPINVDGLVGTVERIGIKTTRVRSLSGEQLVFPNSTLTSAKIRNYQDIAERRYVVGFRIPFQTDVAVARQVPALVKEVVERAPKTRFDRAHLAGFGESALQYEAVFYVLEPDFNRAMDISEQVHFDILEALQKGDIRLATPTHTLIHEGAKGAV